MLGTGDRHTQNPLFKDNTTGRRRPLDYRSFDPPDFRDEEFESIKDGPYLNKAFPDRHNTGKAYMGPGPGPRYEPERNG